MKNKKVPIEIKVLDSMIARKVIEMSKKDNITILSHIQISIIKYLYENKDKVIYQNDIEKKVNLRRSTVSGILNTMEKNKIIERRDSSKDARKKEIVLTSNNCEYDKTKKMMANFEKMLIKDIKKEDLDTFLKVIDKMKENIK